MKKIVISIAVVAISVGSIAAYVRYDRVQDVKNPLISFAQCLTDKGTKMYGAFWCPHCQNQKKLFGRAFKKVTYVECAQPGNSQVQTQVCRDAKIEGYPTWEFGDKTRLSGEISLEELAEKSGCTLPSQ